MQIVHGRVFDDLTVRVTAAAADYEVDKDRQDRIRRPHGAAVHRGLDLPAIGGRRHVEKARHAWRTPARAAVRRLRSNQIGECRYCKAAVTSGKFDWVLSHIEQDQDDEGGGQAKVPAAPDATLRCRSAARSSEGCWPACCRIEDRTIRND